MTTFVTGDKKLDRTLQAIGGKIAEKAVTSGIRAGLGELRKSIRSQVPKPSVRKVVASRFKRRKKAGQVTAKVGAGVGKHKAVKQTIRAKPGVGIAKQNAHWYFLGTQNRRHKSGKSTGRMPSNDAVRTGASLGYGSAMTKLRTKTAAVLMKESAKQGAR